MRPPHESAPTARPRRISPAPCARTRTAACTNRTRAACSLQTAWASACTQFCAVFNRVYSRKPSFYFSPIPIPLACWYLDGQQAKNIIQQFNVTDTGSHVIHSHRAPVICQRLGKSLLSQWKTATFVQPHSNWPVWKGIHSGWPATADWSFECSSHNESRWRRRQ